MSKAQPVLSLHNINKSYAIAGQEIKILNNINLAIGPNTSMGLMGPSGCGKSTLLNIAGLLDAADHGFIQIGRHQIQQGKAFQKASDQSLSQLRLASIGFIFQFHHLLSDFTALENIMAPMRLLSTLSRSEQTERAHYLLNAVDMSHRLNQYPQHLSGGERQRVAIARALANKPKILLADEPTGNLDEKNASEVFELLLQTIKQEKTSLLMVSHNQSLLARMDQTYQLKNGILAPWS
ncbi:MAG: hypothetical protein C0582_00535 [Alphaproteobacteria bacterium]|nr:MAG: hypothetical protein C0582_00535 [Alphaproteobacteria bacterium]